MSSPSPLPLLLLAALLLVAQSASAVETPDERDHVLPCRPTIACTADLVAPGTLEIEAGYQYHRDRAGTAQRSFPFLAKLTLVRWVQAQLGSNGFTAAEGPAPSRYLDDVILGLKFHLVDAAGARPSVALSAALSVPTFAGQTGYLRTWDALFTAYASNDIGPVHLDLNAGLNAFRLESAPRVQGFVALAASANLPPPFGVMAEGYAFSSADPVVKRDAGFLFALTHQPRAWLMFDVGGDIGFFQGTRVYSVFVGLTVIPVVLWRGKG